MRYEDGYVRLPGHLARLEASAAALGYAWRPDLVRRALDDASAGRDGDGAWRVRLLLASDGRPSWQAARMKPPTPEPVPVALARDPVDGGDPWRRHKSTHRSQYDAASAEARRRGLADLLFGDGDGYLVEGAVSTVFVTLRGRDGPVTPPLARGALPGVLRAQLLDRGRAFVDDVPLRALADADAVWIGSSLRGLRQARIAASR